MKNRVLNDDGSYSTYVAPAAEPKSTKPVAPVEPNILEEPADEPNPILVKKDYTIMSAKLLKEECTERGIAFKGNASGKALMELLFEADSKVDDVL